MIPNQRRPAFLTPSTSALVLALTLLTISALPPDPLRAETGDSQAVDSLPAWVSELDVFPSLPVIEGRLEALGLAQPDLERFMPIIASAADTWLTLEAERAEHRAARARVLRGLTTGDADSHITPSNDLRLRELQRLSELEQELLAVGDEQKTRLIVEGAILNLVPDELVTPG